MKYSRIIIILSIALSSMVISLTGCQKSEEKPAAKKTIAVTYSVLASVVKELAGDSFNVVSLIPNGLDLHEWEPSARDMETLAGATLIVQNGLGLEGGMEKALENAKESGVKIFTASEYIVIRKVRSGEDIPSGDPDQALGAEDPHLWMDPLAVKAVVLSLSEFIKKELSADVSDKAASLAKRLDALDESIRKQVEGIPTENRKLVTGHESLGYFAQAYGFTLVGAIIPSLTTQAEESAGDMARIKKQITENKVKVIFTEIGTPPKVVEALAKETGARSLSLTTHFLPQDLSYFTFMTDLASTVTESLK